MFVETLQREAFGIPMLYGTFVERYSRAAINIALANYMRVNYYELQAHNFLIKTPKTPAEPETRPGFYYINWYMPLREHLLS